MANVITETKTKKTTKRDGGGGEVADFYKMIVTLGGINLLIIKSKKKGAF